MVDSARPPSLGPDLPGTMVVMGDGPDLGRLKRRYPRVRFLVEQHGPDLAHHFEDMMQLLRTAMSTRSCRMPNGERNATTNGPAS